VSLQRLALEIERLFGQLTRAGSALGEPSGGYLTPTQGLALRVIVDEGPLRLGALAERMGTTDATATRTVDALERVEFARRVADSQDRRGVKVEATAKGARSLADRRDRRLQVLQQLLSDVPPEHLAHVADVLAQLNDRMQTPAGEPETAGTAQQH
jgi:DNA-binding MarR family transcriptional regulator